MVQFQTFINEIGVLFVNLFSHPDWRNLADIAILTILFYYLIKLVRNTRANSLFKGIVVVLILAWITEFLQLSAINWLLQQVISVGLIVLFVLFQPEMRRALDQLGRSKLTGQIFLNTRHQHRERTEKDINEIIQALVNMSRKRIGALIVFERNTNLSDVIESGTTVDAEISDAIIENIFEPNTPLHDGAMIIRDERIIAAACILTLSEDYTISRELGTRHRAAIGITESTDAVSLIVSEETGIISMARSGKLTRHMDSKSLNILLTELFESNESAEGLARYTRLFGRFTNQKKEGKEESTDANG